MTRKVTDLTVDELVAAHVINPATRPRPLVYGEGIYPRGTYVVATKYSDGDPGDAWCVGFYFGSTIGVGEPRHVVVDGHGVTFRHNGFRRVKRLSVKRGCWIVAHIPMIELLMNHFSVYHWINAPYHELEEYAALGLSS